MGGVAHLERDIIHSHGEFIRGSDAHHPCPAEIALGWNRAEGDPPVVKVHQRAAPDLALLWQFGFDGVGEEFLTVGASPGWRPCEEVEDGLPDGRHARLWRPSPDSFFSVPLL